MGKKKAAGTKDATKAAPRCPVDNCKNRLQGDNIAKCGTCGIDVCQQHQYPTDHVCKKSAPKAAAAGGLTVVSGKSKKNDKASEEEKRKAEARDEELLSKLVSTSSEELLKDLLSFGAASARYESSIAVQALSSESKSIQKTLSGAVGKGLIETATSQGDLDKLTASLSKFLRDQSSAKKLSSSEEQRAVSVAALYGLALDSDESKASDEAVLKLGLDLVHSNFEKLAKAGGNDVLKRVAKARWAEGKDFESGCWPVLCSLVDEILGLPEDADTQRNGLAYGVAGIAGGCGANSAGEPLVDGKLAPLVEDPKNTAAILSCMRIVFVLTKEWGTGIMPYLMPVDFLQKALFNVYDNTASSSRSATKKTILQVVDKMGPRGVRLSVPVFMDGLESGSWRIKALSLQCVGALGKRHMSQLFRELPILIPAVMECNRDTKKQVSDAASEALDNLGELVTNAETIKLMPWILEALKDPEQKVDPCLDELMDTTFVNSVDAQSLAFIIPVVLRGLRDGTAEMKLKGSITAGNVCSLVADVHDMRPYYTLLMPELKKLTDHSRPRVREMALRAKNSLQEDLSMTRRRSSQNSGNGGASAAAAAAVAAVGVGGSGADPADVGDAQAGEVLASKLRELGLESTLGHVAFEYVLSTCRMLMFDLLEDVDQDMPRKLVLKKARDQVAEGVEPFLSNGLANKDDLLEGSAVAIIDALWVAQGKQAHDDQGALAEAEKDYIVFIPSIILAFASRVLLKRAGLFLERGHRYSVVGLNGTGKSTLLTRVAARDIDGFPDDITVYFVEHEIVEDEQALNVLDYMQHDVKEQVSSNKTKKRKGGKKFEELYDLSLENMDRVLREVGFTDALLAQQVSALSGGWKMRLAIARSMLYMPDLLLLDEPTNHLDAAALDWLQKYLAGLDKTTIVLVSHDYDFVDYVATDIIHLADQKLAYYPFGFSRFQQERPEIVAALPKKDDNKKESGGEGEEGGLSAIELMAKAATDESAAALTSGIKPIRFPEGSKLEGVTHRGKPIVQLDHVSYRYPGTERMIFSDVTVKLTLNSRVAILGANGAGKSTLLKLLVGELILDENEGHSGKFWKHHNLRTAYISQHSLHHLEGHLESTPCQYIQDRFFEGRDKEASKMITVKLTEEDKAMMERTGEFAEIISRVVRSKKLFYEVRKNGRAEKGANRDIRSLEELERLSKDRPYIMKMVRLFDEELKFAASGADIRPTTTPEFIKHLAEFGIDADIAQRKVRWMSGGQRARLVLAAAMWTCPHMIILDEPTNYLDQDTVAALTYALKTFRGSVVLISHHQGFVDAVANELWHLKDGTLRSESLKNK